MMRVSLPPLKYSSGHRHLRRSCSSGGRELSGAGALSAAAPASVYDLEHILLHAGGFSSSADDDEAGRFGAKRRPAPSPMVQQLASSSWMPGGPGTLCFPARSMVAPPKAPRRSAIVATYRSRMQRTPRVVDQGFSPPHISSILPEEGWSAALFLETK